MLKDYASFLELIRDNLIQNGISFPTKSFEKYEDCFFVSERLASLSWFLFVNNVSGSTIGEGYALFPQQTYKQKIRSLVYAEYVDVGKDFAGMMLPRRRTDDVDSNFNFLSKSQARVSPFGEQYSRVESAGNEFLDLVKKSQETVEEDDFASWDDFDVDTVEELEETGAEDIEVANLVEDEDGFLVDEDSLKANEGDSNGSNGSEDWVSEDSEDDFDDWGSGDSEEDEDEFESWDNSVEDESVEDDFESWGTDTSEVEDDADFDDWGSSDDADFDDWESPSEEDEDDFDDWGNSDVTDDSDFDDWGGSDDSEDLETDFEDDADFDDWGSDEEDEQEEELEDDEDFDDWGDSEEGSEDETAKAEKGTPSKQIKRSPASELKAETEMMDFFQRGVNSLFRSTVSNGKKFGRRFASLPENEEE